MDTNCIRKTLVRTMYVMVILTVVLSASTVAYAAPQSPFVGHWQAVDIDGSVIRLTIAGSPTGPFKITSTESYISFCNGEAGIVKGQGWLNENDPYILEADLTVRCLAAGEIMNFHLAWRYHLLTNMLSSRYDNGMVTIWHRPGRPTEPPPFLGLRVNYGHDWVESFYEAGHTAWITVTESDGVTVKATAELVTEPKDFWDGETGFQTGPEDWVPAPPDIQPYDWVYGWVDNGASAQVQIGNVSGAIDLVADSIEGTIDAPWFTDRVQVECLDWGSGQEPPFDNADGGFVLTNGEDPYSCSWFGGWDIQPYQDVGVGYLGPDGNWVANAITAPNPRIVASEAGDWLWVTEFYPGKLDISIFASVDEDADLLWTGQQEVTDFWGITSVGYDVHGQDLVPGNYLVVSDGVNQKGLVLEAITVDMFDVNYDFMTGTAPKGRDVWVAAGPQEYQEGMWVNADGDTGDQDIGSWFADFTTLGDSGYDITEEMQPWSYAQIFDEDGDANEADPPPLEFWAAAFTYDPPHWTEGEHNYHFENAYTFPEPGGGTTAPIEFTVSAGGPQYEGYVQLRYWSLLALVNGACSPIDSALYPGQDTRFVYGWVTDYPMTYEEAVAHFDSMVAYVTWDAEEPVELMRHEIIPYNPDDWSQYVCMFTS